MLRPLIYAMQAQGNANCSLEHIIKAKNSTDIEFSCFNRDQKIHTSWAYSSWKKEENERKIDEKSRKFKTTILLFTKSDYDYTFKTPIFKN
jgi:hypothetical protein